MRRLSLIVFLVCLVCFMSNSVFASEFWMQADPWFAATDNWMEPNQWDLAQTGPPSATPGVPPTSTTQEIKLYAGSWTTPPTHCTIDSNDVGIYYGQSSGGGRHTVNADLTIKGEANYGTTRTGSKNGLRVGSLSVGGITTRGDVNQSAGTVSLPNLYLGYGGTMTSDNGAEGYYIISGGSLTVWDDPQSGGLSTGGLCIASGINQASTNSTKTMTGKFTVDCTTGSTPTINVTSLTVGGNITSGNPGENNTGTLEFKLGSISPINCSSLVFLGGDPNTTANLIVSWTDEDPPPPAIVLVKNSSGNAVVGTFDSVTLNGLPGYHVVYNYNADGTANDIALIPEPATIALFGLGLLALVRRQHRK